MRTSARWMKKKTTDIHSDNDTMISPKKLEIKCIDLGSESTLGIVVVDQKE